MKYKTGGEFTCIGDRVRASGACEAAMTARRCA